MKKVIILLFACALSLGQAASQTLSFLQITQDPAIAGLAGAGVAVRSISPLENNLADAALGQDKLRVAASYTLWQPKVDKYGLVGASASFRVIPKLAVAVSVKGFLSPAYQVASANGQAGGSFKPMDLSFAAGAAYQISKNFSAGVDAKFLTSSLGEGLKGNTVAFDASLKFASKSLEAGLVLSNLGGKIKYGEASYSLPMAAKAGAAYTISGFTASLEADYVFSAGFMAGLGVQYAFKDMLFARAGYHYAASDKLLPSHAAVGLGVKFAGVSLDATFLLASSTLTGTLAFGLGYSF